MPEPFTRIFSDLHFGDRASRLRSLREIAPLLDGPARIVVNGDALDTRAGPHPERTAALRTEVLEFFTRDSPPTVLLTGNHDNDISPLHSLELGDGAIFLTHGDVLSEDIVPWGRDVPEIRRLMAEEKARIPESARSTLEGRLALLRRVGGRLRQRHQMETNPWKHARSFLADTIWPPDKFLRILQVWRHTPILAAALLKAHRPNARFIVIGHYHRPGVWRQPDGRVVINTGSFCPPLGGAVVDVFQDRLVVRRFRRIRGEFRPGEVIATFPIAEIGPPRGVA